MAVSSVILLFELIFLNSLIIHPVKTKEIMTVTVVSIPGPVLISLDFDDLLHC